MLQVPIAGRRRAGYPSAYGVQAHRPVCLQPGFGWGHLEMLLLPGLVMHSTVQRPSLPQEGASPGAEEQLHGS